MPPRKNLTAQTKSSPRSKHYPSQSDQTLLKDFFQLNPSTVLDPGHTTTKLNADRSIHFVRVDGLQITLASYGLIEDFLLHETLAL